MGSRIWLALAIIIICPTLTRTVPVDGDGGGASPRRVVVSGSRWAKTGRFGAKSKESGTGVVEASSVAQRWSRARSLVPPSERKLRQGARVAAFTAARGENPNPQGKRRETMKEKRYSRAASREGHVPQRSYPPPRRRKEQGPPHFPVTPPKAGVDQCHDGLSEASKATLRRAKNALIVPQGPGVCLTFANGTRYGRRAGRNSMECKRDSRQGKPGACPDRAWVTVASRSRDIDMALVMVRSLRTVGTCADVVILAWEDALNLTTHQSNLARILNVQIVETWQPIVEADVPPSSFLYKRMQEFEKWWSFTRLMPYTLLQYKLVINLDADLMFRENVDELLFQPRGLHSDGPWSPFNAGLYSMEPSCKVRDFLVNIVREADFHDGPGWKKKTRMFFAVEWMQGLMYWYTHFYDKTFHVVDRAVYNYQGIHSHWERIRDSGHVMPKVVHFTLCRKPVPIEHFRPHENNSQAAASFGRIALCPLFHKEYQTMVWQNSIEREVVLQDHIKSCEDPEDPCYCDGMYGCSTRPRAVCFGEDECAAAGEAMAGVQVGLVGKVKEVCVVSGGLHSNYTFHGCTKEERNNSKDREANRKDSEIKEERNNS
mmetsp:Transcript_66779/g.211307  ORF Transcript_66779/g.211307 Transcript_66779/m.211307 type:complete len:601 (+) Transcript_66779:131-1933(+)